MNDNKMKAKGRCSRRARDLLGWRSEGSRPRTAGRAQIAAGSCGARDLEALSARPAELGCRPIALGPPISPAPSTGESNLYLTGRLTSHQSWEESSGGPSGGGEPSHMPEAGSPR